MVGGLFDLLSNLLFVGIVVVREFVLILLARRRESHKV